MWTRVFLASLSVFALVLGFAAYYAASWLGSIGLPADAFAGYEYFRGLNWWILAITTVVLLILANIKFTRSGDGWALWVTFIYFAVFVIAIGFVLPLAAIGFMRDKGFAPELSQYLSPFAAIGLIVGFGAVVYLNHFLIKRMRGGLEREGDTVADEMDDMEATNDTP